MDLNFGSLSGVWIAFVVILVAVILFYVIRRFLIWYRKYRAWHTEDEQENVRAYYHFISEKLRKKDKDYQTCPTYESQLKFIKMNYGEFTWDEKELAQKMERLTYSKHGISSEECEQMMQILSEIEKKGRSRKNG